MVLMKVGGKNKEYLHFYEIPCNKEEKNASSMVRNKKFKLKHFYKIGVQSSIDRNMSHLLLFVVALLVFGKQS